MTSQSSEIVRAFVHGEPVTRIAESRGISYGRAWAQIRRAIADADQQDV